MSDLGYRHISEVWTDTAKHLVFPPQGIKLSWWVKFSDMLGGLRLHELTLLCAPTGAGKTQLLANMSAQLALQGVPHFVAPVETGDVDYITRVVSALEARDLNSGDRQPEAYLMDVSQRYAQILFQQSMYIATYDNRVAIEDMCSMLTYMHEIHGVKVALLDNLNFFLKVVSSQLEKAEMDSAIHELVMLVKKLPMHIILVVHPKKTDGGRVLSEFDIKGSSTAVQEAANVLLFNRPEAKLIEEGLREMTDRELVFRKIRKRGQHVGKPIWLSYNNARLEELRA